MKTDRSHRILPPWNSTQYRKKIRGASMDSIRIGITRDGCSLMAVGLKPGHMENGRYGGLSRFWFQYSSQNALGVVKIDLAIRLGAQRLRKNPRVRRTQGGPILVQKPNKQGHRPRLNPYFPIRFLELLRSQRKLPWPALFPKNLWVLLFCFPLFRILEFRRF